MTDNKRTNEDYYIVSKRLRNEVLKQAEQLKGHPMRFIITNHITMRVEITKTDLKTIVSKNVGDDKFNAIKNALAKDIPGYLEKAQYLGWRPVAEGKHIENRRYAIVEPYPVIHDSSEHEIGTHAAALICPHCSPSRPPGFWKL